MSERINLDTLQRIIDMGEYKFEGQDARYSADAIDCSGYVSFTCRISSGAMDHLLQRPTLAAYRYVRLQKRHKEKERRKKLKEDRHED